MKIVFSILPFLISILAIVTKRRIVNAQSGKKYAYREMVIDTIRLLVATIMAISANFLCGKDIKIWPFVIDLFMMMVYLLPLLQKNYDYVERKALMGIWSSCVFMLPMAIAIFQMLIGTYDREDTTLASCFLKGVCYFGISIWCCFTTESKVEKNKIKVLINGLKYSYKKYKLATLDYYMLAFLELFIFVGMKDYFVSIGIFGLHEIINKRILKGMIFIILGNVCLFLQYKTPFWGEIATIVYTLVALGDIFVHFIKQRNSK